MSLQIEKACFCLAATFTRKKISQAKLSFFYCSALILIVIQFFILEELRFFGLKILRNLHVTESRFHRKSFYMRILDVFKGRVELV